MVYDPNGSNNSSLLSLVAGTITFVAGETAKHGDMKVDTPVATMGIRGTAVLVQIDFTVPGQGAPDAKFQVLVEPDGTTGSYILFDKSTLTPLAVVDQAGLQINISNGVMSQTLTPLSPEIEKLINDVFTLKFTDNSDTKSIQNFTDTITPQTLGPTKLAGLDTVTPVVLFTSPSNTPFLLPANAPIIPPADPHFALPPSVAVSGNAALAAHIGSETDSV
jgi:fibronectin-binding autotransporter adhesin